MITVSLDPGLHVAGLAYAIDGDIVRVRSVRRRGSRKVSRQVAWLLQGTTLGAEIMLDVMELTGGITVHKLIYESMVLYSNDGQKRFEALSALEAISSIVIVATRPIRTIEVSSKQWTRGRNKLANHPRILSKLDANSEIHEVPLDMGTKDRIMAGKVRNMDELSSLEGDTEHAIDAVGLLLHHTKRL
jgi:hypothetical protein